MHITENPSASRSSSSSPQHHIRNINCVAPAQQLGVRINSITHNLILKVLFMFKSGNLFSYTKVCKIRCEAASGCASKQTPTPAHHTHRFHQIHDIIK